MVVPRIFTTHSLAEGITLRLEEGPSRHLAGALRLREGAAITLFNGNGGEYEAHLTVIERKQVTVELGRHDPIERESPLHTELGIAISRGERMDWVIQKATELGINTISPLFSERTEVKLKGDRADKKLRHWRQVAISACEQCGRNQLPDIAPLATVSEWTERADAECKLVLHHRNTKPLAGGSAPANVALLIGPEGGLSEAEINKAETAGFSPMALGPRVLRTETAPLAALSLVQQQWGDMG